MCYVFMPWHLFTYHILGILYVNISKSYAILRLIHEIQLVDIQQSIENGIIFAVSWKATYHWHIMIPIMEISIA